MKRSWIFTTVFIFGLLYAVSPPLIWKDYKYTVSTPHTYSTSANHLVVNRTAAGQDSIIYSSPFSFDARDKQFNGLLTLTVKHDSVAVSTDTLIYFLQQNIGGTWVTIVDPITWIVASTTMSVTHDTVFIPTHYDSVMVWSNIPNDTSATNVHRHALNQYRMGVRMDDSQDSVQVGIDNRAFGY